MGSLDMFDCNEITKNEWRNWLSKYISGVVRQYVLSTPLVDRGISKYSRIKNTSRPAYCRVTENIKSNKEWWCLQL